MSFRTIRVEVADRIATVTLDRPDQMNAITDELTTELHDAVQALGRDPTVRAIVLTGAGRAFCAGGDITGFGGQTPDELLTKLPRPFDMNRRPDYQTRHTYMPAIGKPVVAMINGPVAGLGLVYALFCDLRFAAEEAVFTTAFARRGLSGEYGMAWILPRVVGHANALDLALSARKVDGREAQRLGLVNRAVPRAELAETTYAYVRDLVANCSPRSMRELKRQIWETPFQALHEAVMMANVDMRVSNVGPDFKEGTASFREKRPPNFPDLEG